MALGLYVIIRFNVKTDLTNEYVCSSVVALTTAEQLRFDFCTLEDSHNRNFSRLALFHVGVAKTASLIYSLLRARILRANPTMAFMS